MSLAVWLPLNGDLHNQGLSSTTFSGTAAYKSYGKLGGQSLSLQNRITCSTPALNGVQFFSIAFWCRIEDNPDSTENWMDVIGFTDQKSDNSANGQFRFETGYLSDSEGGIHWHDNDIYAIIMGSNKYNTAAQRNEWHHIVVTVANNSVKSYYDGALQNTQTTSLNKGHLTGSWWLGQSTTRGCIQDVRIYDHALSSKEVEEISKGLVLHYPLNNNGLGNTNLALNTFYEMRPYTISSYYIGKDLSTNFFNLSVGDTYTCRAKITAGQKNTCLRIEFYTNGNTRTSIFGNWIAAGTTGYSTITSTLTAEQRNYSLMQICLHSGVDTSTSGEYGELKLEKGSIATPWCPNNINTNIIYDTSGYCNNGIVVGDITTITPSPRYNCAINCDTTSSHIIIENLIVTGFINSYSIAWWGKVTSFANYMMWGFTNGNARLNGIYKGSFWNTGDGGANPLYEPGTTTQVSVPTSNVWHHFVMVGDGSTCLVYKDGLLWAQAKTYKSLTGTSICINGWSQTSSPNYALANTKISDFRIYATALNANQIKELYNTSMQIDSSGNVFARELVEL